MVKLKSGYLEGTIGMLHGEAQAELRTEFNINSYDWRTTTQCWGSGLFLGGTGAEVLQPLWLHPKKVKNTFNITNLG